jgi:hypothetical protein
MKINRFLLAISMALASSAYAGLYLDAGAGYGYGMATEKWGSSYWRSANDEGKEVHVPRVGFDAGVKFGGGLSKIGLFFVGELSIVSPLTVPYPVGSAVFYMIGPGIIFYPTQNLQIGSSIGAAYHEDFDSDDGYAYNFSIAYDFGDFNHGVLLGIKYYGASNSYDDGYKNRKIESSMIGMFIKYVYKKRSAALTDDKRKRQRKAEWSENIH